MHAPARSVATALVVLSVAACGSSGGSGATAARTTPVAPTTADPGATVVAPTAATPNPDVASASGDAIGSLSDPSAAAAATASLPPLTGTGTALPSRIPLGPVPSDAKADPTPLITVTYQAWLADISGLYDNLTNPWIKAISEVATERLTIASQRSAAAIHKAKDHGVGTLVDSHLVVVVAKDGQTAQVGDCLDELHWYVVSDASGQPDRSVRRGYYNGGANMIRQADGTWRVDAWVSAGKECTF